VTLEAIVFDAEGVIIDTETIWDEGQRVFLGRRGIEYDRALVKPMLTGRSLKDGAATLAELYGIPGDPEELARERADIVRDLMPGVEFIPGFREFFDSVRERYRTCVATAMADDLFELVDRNLGLRDLFGGHVYMLSDVGHRSKPDPALFLFAAAKIETPPQACLVIEDSPHGVEAAHRAGMWVVGLATTYEPEALAGANEVVRTFAEIDLAARRSFLDGREPAQRQAGDRDVGDGENRQVQ
jgi:beta-phosphoglucomutase